MKPSPACRPTHTSIDQFEGADLGRSVAELRHDLDGLVRRADALGRLCADPTLPDRLEVAEGPFVDDAPAALDTARIWLERAHLMLHVPTRALANAHIALGGLADGTNKQGPT